jgi:N-acetyl-gamma-glutamyl-phosphate reductase
MCSLPYDNILIPMTRPRSIRQCGVLCTPHTPRALGQKVIEAGARCVDLSAICGFTIKPSMKPIMVTHPRQNCCPAIYGLTEIYRAQIAGARLVGNPGCYPTGPLLALYPLLRAGAVTGERVIIDAKSGVSGAGVKPSPTTHFVAVHDNFNGYNVGHTHRHVPEIEQELSIFCPTPRADCLYAPSAACFTRYPLYYLCESGPS